MGPILHAGITVGLLAAADLSGFKINKEVIAAAVLGGFFLDGDKAIEIVSNRLRAKKGKIPDITARCRILHSVFAFPYGLGLSLLTLSFIPFVEVLYHILADSFLPGLVKNGKYYPPHSPKKWLANPFSAKSWKKVSIGWPITYPPEFNWVYTELGPSVGVILLGLSLIYAIWTI